MSHHVSRRPNGAASIDGDGVNTQHRCIFLTGATGFLGAQIARRLLREADLTVIVLVRGADQAVAARRLARVWWDWPELIAALTPGSSSDVDEGDRPLPQPAARVEVLAGDVSLPHLGLDDATYARLAARITHMIHSAADLRFDAPLEEMRRTNVQGTANMLELARLVQRDHGLQRYAHVSTAYVAGRRRGVISEADLNDDALADEVGFSNAYEQSKYEGERLVQAAKDELPISVFRPGMIVGASDTGEIRTFNTVYFPLRLYLTGKLNVMPVDPNLPVNIVPVDYVAEAVVRLTFCPGAEGLNFHLTAPAEALPRVKELVQSVRVWAREALGLRLPPPVLLRLPLPERRYRPDRDPGQRSEGHARAWRRPLWPALRGLLMYLPYLGDRKQFRRDNVDRLLGPYTLDWREFLPRLLAYAVDNSFMHRSERTVHEQLLTRLSSRSRPLVYFDVVQGELIRHSGDDMRREIAAAAGALSALGVLPGDRVAIVGLNSTRYLALETAIGLIGAVNVPLYYTSPPAEIDTILSSSEARLLFVGAPAILERLGELRAQLPVVSFCRGEVPGGAQREVIAWDAFLALGEGCPLPLQAPVGLGDLATLCYTSGTTGHPKGVSFQHQHLRWMGQTLASLMPWKPRNRKANYLSFLPMNHVVEGILATYCPFYVPTSVNIYFLEDLRDVQRTLPRIRPTIFFSVPRIYEKIWEVLEDNPVGRYNFNLPDKRFADRLWKRALGAFLGRQTLRKAGLNRCAQLIAGSASCSQELLERFRGLGIEVYNAYGLTEAPLVSLNRLGANRLGTVGIPLPQTEIRIAEDGEVLVRGPQVMAGYLDGQQSGAGIEQPFCDGWLQTGDLGYLSPEGSLILNGRKKDLIKTSYGKCIQPTKVESLLREIPGVAEAMLVGEERPYCVALLWVKDEVLNADAAQRIDALVGQVNRGLSHPEQVKRWAVLSNDLSTETGDLTGSLKLKRRAIIRRLADVLASLYDGTPSPQVVLHIGGATSETFGVSRSSMRPPDKETPKVFRKP